MDCSDDKGGIAKNKRLNLSKFDALLKVRKGSIARTIACALAFYYC